ncbi:hypothetical protein [Sphingomonas aracearum]|uniref:DUF4136 domain-containing protein n=1 Tax=Sphingomonas aracearum TaxID=2283317 RepID=A0A369VRK0_9SPHN|nr:hypothetical protein [Sphingomonas aracearum]RDE05006.1 hypothetical protein DVW87_13250 [Sphingomonas aracearum]
MKLRAVTGLAGAALLAACTTTSASGPVEVSRFNIANPGQPFERGTIRVEPAPGGGPPSLEFKTYAAAVETEALRNGYTAAVPNVREQYLAVVSFNRGVLEGPPRPPAFSLGLGLGGASFGRRSGVGVGGGVGVPIGKERRGRQIVTTELAVQIRRQSDGTAVWEGRAQTSADVNAPQAQASAAAGRLAHALFLGFPGESGRTIEVK